MKKKVLLFAMLLFCCIGQAFAQAQIKFDKVTYNFGTFSESQPVQKCTFTFTNVGDKPLVINQALASCGCTVPSYTKAPKGHHRPHKWRPGDDETLHRR